MPFLLLARGSAIAVPLSLLLLHEGRSLTPAVVSRAVVSCGDEAVASLWYYRCGLGMTCYVCVCMCVLWFVNDLYNCVCIYV